MTMFYDALTNLVGGAAMLSLVCSPLFKRRSTILFMQLSANLLLLVYFALMGLAVAAIANLFTCVQIVSAVYAAGSARARTIGYALIAMMIAIGIALWDGTLSALSISAMILTAIARMESDVVRLRFIYLAGGAVWALHDYLASAWFAFAADVGTALVGVAALTALLRHRVGGGGEMTSFRSLALLAAARARV